MNAPIALPRFSDLIARGGREHGGQGYSEMLAVGLLLALVTGDVPDHLVPLMDAFDHDLREHFDLPREGRADQSPPPDTDPPATADAPRDRGPAAPPNTR